MAENRFIDGPSGGPPGAPLKILLVFPLLVFFIPFTSEFGSVRGGNAPPEITLNAETVNQGDVYAVTVSAPESATPIGGLFHDSPFSFHEFGSSYVALIGAPVITNPGTHLIRIDLETEGGKLRSYFLPAVVREKEFGESRITLPPDMVDYPSEVLERIRAEAASVRELTQWPGDDPADESGGGRLWEGPFILPVKSRVTSAFGRKRFLNDQPRSPHSGVDLRARTGTPVRAPNSGVIALIGDHYLTGLTVVLDHGLGLFSLYYHLSGVKVAEGEFIEKGSILGLAGSSGRSTGPHLHWGATLGGVRVDPMSLVEVTGALEEGDLNLASSI